MKIACNMLGLQQHNAIPCVVGLEIFPLLLLSATKTDKASVQQRHEPPQHSVYRASRLLTINTLHNLQ